MTSREDFGEPLGSDLLLEIGVLYLRRGLLLAGVRGLLSSVPLDTAEATLQAALVELRSQRSEH